MMLRCQICLCNTLEWHGTSDLLKTLKPCTLFCWYGSIADAELIDNKILWWAALHSMFCGGQHYTGCVGGDLGKSLA